MTKAGIISGLCAVAIAMGLLLVAGQSAVAEENTITLSSAGEYEYVDLGEYSEGDVVSFYWSSTEDVMFMVSNDNGDVYDRHGNLWDVEGEDYDYTEYLDAIYGSEGSAEITVTEASHFYMTFYYYTAAAEVTYTWGEGAGDTTDGNETEEEEEEDDGGFIPMAGLVGGLTVFAMVALMVYVIRKK